MGTIRQDRFDAIYGVVGENDPPMIPVTAHIQSTLNTRADYKFEVIQEPFLSPLLVNLAFVSTLSNTERAVGASTLEINGKIRLGGGEAVDFQDVLSGEMGTAALAGSAKMPVAAANKPCACKISSSLTVMENPPLSSTAFRARCAFAGTETEIESAIVFGFAASS